RRTPFVSPQPTADGLRRAVRWPFGRRRTMPASRVRGRVLAFAFLLAVVTYLDRICISAAAPYIMRDLHLTVLQMSVVFSAFALAYSLFEIPSGWLRDVLGPPRLLPPILAW